MGKCTDVLGQAGLLQTAIPEFIPRQAQLKMAIDIEIALKQRSVLLVEAGTGTGKTFAYLVPALESGLKIIISTGSRQLQDQLYQTDLPRLMQLLGHVTRSLLKGRSNYLCLYRLTQTVDYYNNQLVQNFADLDRVKQWSYATQVGDIAELTDVSEDAAVWTSVTSTIENCLGGNCPDFQNCYVVKARQRAQEAQLVVINHHLFIADSLSDENNTLIPHADAYIIDEAHQLPDIATRFWGIELSAHALQDFMRDFRTQWREDAGDVAVKEEWFVAISALSKQIHQQLPEDSGRSRFTAEVSAQLNEAEQKFKSVMRQIVDWLQLMQARSRGLERLYERALSILLNAEQLLHLGHEEDAVHWYDRSQSGWRLGITPLAIDKKFQDFMQSRQGAAWVFTSATLAVHQDFSYYAGRLGLHDFCSSVFASPFDYATQGLLYAPRNLPNPRHQEYSRSLFAEIRWLITVSQGRAFLLFTSHRVLKEATEALADLPWPLLIQGQKPRHALVEDFKQSGKAVLLATGSFWEGVDVPGEALSLLVIDRLPFAPPTDPWIEARSRSLKAQGLSAFNELQLPAAMMMLKQGAGRLIRTMNDRGVLVIADPRLYMCNYGQQFLQALPPMPRTHERNRVQQFFADTAIKTSANNAPELQALSQENRQI